MATTTYQPYTIKENDVIGTSLRVHTAKATLPEYVLPVRVVLTAAWKTEGGTTVRSWFARHDGGLISLPTILGDGSESLAQLVEWLERHGYRENETESQPGQPEYVRPTQSVGV